MLQSMRQNLKSLQIFLWLVIAAFISTIFFVWGQGNQRGESPGQNAVAWVNGQPISYVSFENSYRSIYGFYQQMYGDNMTPEMASSLQLDQVAMNQLTQRVLLAQEAQNYQLYVSDEELIQAIWDMPQFQTNGRFDRELYEKLLGRLRFTPQNLKTRQKKVC